MKLINRILIRVSILLSIIVAAWAFLFYTAIVDEINDEMDDSLEEYSESIIRRVLAGEGLPPEDVTLRNRYFLSEISAAYAEERAKHKDVYYTDEEESTRVLSEIFKNEDGNYYELLVSTPTVEKDELREAIFYWCILLYISLLLTIVLVYAWVFYRSMKPLYILLDWLGAYRIGKTNPPLKNETSITEFQRLNEAIVRNAERNEAMFEQQKQFIGNASHEIQTPLAICQNRLEGLMEDDSLTEAQMEEIYKTRRTLEHITKLNRSLLLLTKIENDQFMDVIIVDVNALIRRYLDDFKDVYAYKNIQVHLDMEETVSITMNESLAASLFSNLIKNAFVHNLENGEIEMGLTRDRFVICNSGEPRPLDKEHIFDRFYQGRKKEGSTGLGLAIADAICVSQGMCLSYDYEREKHSFKINWRNR